MTRTLTLLGSTGSIGTQALDVVRRANAAEPGRFRVVALAASGARPDLLAEQALSHGVEVVAVHWAGAAQDLMLAFYAAAGRRGYAAGAWNPPRVLAGPDAAAELAAEPADLVLNGIAGGAGLAATLAALEAGRVVGLANKESLTLGGPVVLRALHGDDPLVRLLPVDSEHSALWQCLAGAHRGEVAALTLTASGGPFRGRDRAELRDVTPAQALAHPTWEMGPLVTVNSATLMNKGLETIEAHLLFGHLLPGAPYDAIGTVVHPQSLVHSMVTYADGSTLAQLSPPDMRLPISLALGWPARVAGAAPAMDWSAATTMTFEPLDTAAFPAVELCREAGRSGGTAPAVLTAANEEAVAAFLAGHLGFLPIVETVAAVLAEHTDGHEFTAEPTLEDVLHAESWARARAKELTRP